MGRRLHLRYGASAIAVVAAVSMLIPGLAQAQDATSKLQVQPTQEELAQKLQHGTVSDSVAQAQGSVNAFIQLDKKSGVEVKADKLNGNLHPSAAQEKAADRSGTAAAAQVEKTADTLVAQLKKLDPQAQVQYTTSYALSGVAVKADSLALMKLARNNSHVLRVVPQSSAQALAPGADQPGNAISDAITNVTSTWQQTGKTGKGVNIAIMDTGLDYTHADFGGPGTPEAYKTAYASRDKDPLKDPVLSKLLDKNKFKGGWDFAGHDYDAEKDDTQAVPDPNPIDGSAEDGNSGHGTHVAGTALGYGVNADGTTFRGDYSQLSAQAAQKMKVAPGAAPEAGVYSLKVFGDKGGRTNLVPQALNWVAEHNMKAAPADKISIVSMSIVSTFVSPDNPEAIAVNNLNRSGVLSVASAGNDGDVTDIAGVPGSAKAALAVAGTNSGQVRVPNMMVNSGLSDKQTLLGTYASQVPAAVTGQVVRLTHLRDDIDPNDQALTSRYFAGCIGFSDADKPLLKGKILYSTYDEKSTCTVDSIAEDAKDAGALGLVILSSKEVGQFNQFWSRDKFPAFAISASQISRDELEKAVDSGDLNVTLSPQTESTSGYVPDDRNSADTVYSQTSRGFHGSFDGMVKPDVSAPAYMISSAKAGSGTEAWNMAGTSMAAPNVAGIAALVKQAHPDWQATQLKRQIMNTADHDVYNADKTVVEGPLRNGSGRVDALAAVNNKVQLTGEDEEEVSEGFGILQVPQAGLTMSKKVTVINTSDTARSYAVKYEPRVSTPGVTYTVSAQQVSVPAHGKAQLSVTVTADQAAMKHTKDPAVTQPKYARPGAYVTDASGVLRLTPLSPASDADASARPLRLVVSSAPRPFSETHVEVSKPVDGTAQLSVIGHGIRQGEGQEEYNSQEYPLVLLGTDPVDAYTGDLNQTGQFSQAAGDIRAVGYSSTAPQLDDPSEGLLSVGIVTDKAHSNLMTPDMTPFVYFDVNNDGKFDYRVYADPATAGSAGWTSYSSVIDAELEKAVTQKDGSIEFKYVQRSDVDPMFVYDNNQLVLTVPLKYLGYTSEEKNPQLHIAVITASGSTDPSELSAPYNIPHRGVIDSWSMKQGESVNPYAPALSFGNLSAQGAQRMGEKKVAARALSKLQASPTGAVAAPGVVSFDDQDGQKVPVTLGKDGASQKILSIHNLGFSPIRAEDQADPEIDPLTPVDKTQLQKAVDDYSKVSGDTYTPESYAELHKQLDAARAVLADPNADQQAVDAAYQALTNAFNGLVVKKPGVDKTRLEAQQKAAQALKAEDYTDESFAMLKQAMKAAQEVLDNPDATQEEVDKALNTLSAAMDALVKRPATEPDNPGKPDDPNKPDNPGEPGKPDNPGKPDQPSEPGKPGKPGKPSEPSKPAEPGKDAQKPHTSSKPRVVASSRLGETGADANVMALAAIVLLNTGCTLLLISRRRTRKEK